MSGRPKRSKGTSGHVVFEEIIRKLHRAAVSAAVGLAAATLTGCGLGTTRVVVVTAAPTARVARTAATPISAAAAPATTARHRAPRPRPAAAATTAQAPVATYVDPVKVVQEFYSDLNRRNFEAAYSIGGYNTFGGNDYQRWVAGYADTTGVIGHASDAGNGVVDTTFNAHHTDGSVQTFAGTYTVRNGVIVDAHLHLVSTR